jgi:hypothetical protein
MLHVEDPKLRAALLRPAVMNSQLVANAAKNGMKLKSYGWAPPNESKTPTLYAMFAVSGRTMPEYCYSPDDIDELSFQFVKTPAGWRVASFGGRPC